MKVIKKVVKWYFRRLEGNVLLTPSCMIPIK